jgi:hypothetical protein
MDAERDGRKLRPEVWAEGPTEDYYQLGCGWDRTAPDAPVSDLVLRRRAAAAPSAVRRVFTGRYRDRGWCR